MCSITNPACLCPCSEEDGWILDCMLPGNTDLPSNYLPAVRMDNTAHLAARVTWIQTPAAVSHLCRSCELTLLPLPLSQHRLSCSLISEWPLPPSHNLFHRHRENLRGKVCFLFSRHHTVCTGHTTPGICVSFGPSVPHLLHCSPMCFRGKST